MYFCRYKNSNITVRLFLFRVKWDETVSYRLKVKYLPSIFHHESLQCRMPNQEQMTSHEGLPEKVSRVGGFLANDMADFPKIAFGGFFSLLLNLIYVQNLGLTLISSPPPGSGVITNSLLAIIDMYNPSPLDKHRHLHWHRYSLGHR